MKRIFLTEGEKKVLRMLQHNEDCGKLFHSYAFIEAVDTLQEKGFVRGAFVEGHTLEDLHLLNKGKAYLEEYPSLRNPIDWKWIISLIVNLHIIGVCIWLMFI
ncbi:MAG: hypothetical protein LUC22_02240 [Prevotella sp.]|nr:hypothetical protein [Prevotella sp.]